MNEITTLENESEKSKDQFENIEVEMGMQKPRPPLRKIDSTQTNQIEQRMLMSQSDWNNDGLNQDIQREIDSATIPGFADHVA